MCGIFGLVVQRDAQFDAGFVRKALMQLALLSESRGKDSSGLVLRKPGAQSLHVMKGPITLKSLLKQASVARQVDQAFKDYVGGAMPRGGFVAMGHSRLVTNGTQSKDVNNQPIVKNGLIAIHNGIIVNDRQLWAAQPSLQREFDIDTEVMVAMVAASMRAGAPIAAALRTALAQVVGTVSTALLSETENFLALASNNGSLYVLTDGRSLFAFASEEFILRTLAAKLDLHQARGFTIAQVQLDEVLVLDLDSLGTYTGAVRRDAPKTQIETFSSGQHQNELIFDPAYLAAAPAALSQSALLEFNEDRIRAMRRCSKCILPESFPFIHFDADGVCNYCNNHIPKNRPNPKALDDLMNLVAPYRRHKGYDCIIPYSGGRDSTHTLHLVKNVLKLKPIAFTYDWGMVNDLARRNIARVCGKLGVENVIVSADIAKKRDNIRKNVSAWLAQPSLGMVPLFMAGDKYFFYYTDRLKKQTGVQLNIWGINSLENTEFKVGFLGVKPDFLKKRIYSLSMKRQASLFANVAGNIASNPRYLNSSMLDTFGSFVSRSIAPHRDYFHLYDYLPWNEREVNDLVLNEYDWEMAVDSNTTWRIGDGTAAFYNYIYNTVAGFSEYDTFRSNQIREGMMSREEALRVVAEENRPRYASLRWYTDIINIDFESTIKRINAIPKLYS